MLRRVVHSSLGFLVAMSTIFFNRSSSVDWFVYIFLLYDTFNAFLIESMYPFSDVGVMMVDCHLYFWNRIVIIFEQDDLYAVIRVLIFKKYKIFLSSSAIGLRIVSLHNSNNPKKWLAKGVVVCRLNKQS